jgi:hypothetical protein
MYAVTLNAMAFIHVISIRFHPRNISTMDGADDAKQEIDFALRVALEATRVFRARSGD